MKFLGIAFVPGNKLPLCCWTLPIRISTGCFSLREAAALEAARERKKNKH